MGYPICPPPYYSTFTTTTPPSSNPYTPFASFPNPYDYYGKPESTHPYSEFQPPPPSSPPLPYSQPQPPPPYSPTSCFSHGYTPPSPNQYTSSSNPYTPLANLYSPLASLYSQSQPPPPSSPPLYSPPLPFHSTDTPPPSPIHPYSQPVGAYPHPSASSQPVSSFQNTGSYVGSASNSNTYYNPPNYGTPATVWNNYSSFSSNPYTNSFPDSNSSCSSSAANLPPTKPPESDTFTSWPNLKTTEDYKNPTSPASGPPSSRQPESWNPVLPTDQIGVLSPAILVVHETTPTIEQQVAQNEPAICITHEQSSIISTAMRTKESSNQAPSPLPPRLMEEATFAVRYESPTAAKIPFTPILVAFPPPVIRDSDSVSLMIPPPKPPEPPDLSFKPADSTTPPPPPRPPESDTLTMITPSGSANRVSAPPLSSSSSSPPPPLPKPPDPISQKGPTAPFHFTPPPSDTTDLNDSTPTQSRPFTTEPTPPFDSHQLAKTASKPHVLHTVYADKNLCASPTVPHAQYHARPQPSDSSHAVVNDSRSLRNITPRMLPIHYSPDAIVFPAAPLVTTNQSVPTIKAIVASLIATHVSPCAALNVPAAPKALKQPSDQQHLSKFRSQPFRETTIHVHHSPPTTALHVSQSILLNSIKLLHTPSIFSVIWRQPFVKSKPTIIPILSSKPWSCSVRALIAPILYQSSPHVRPVSQNAQTNCGGGSLSFNDMDVVLFKQWDPGKSIQENNFYNLEDNVGFHGVWNVRKYYGLVGSLGLLLERPY